MKQLYTLCLCSFAAITINAQITITSADMPNAGDTIRVSLANSVGTNNPALTGANYSWNYSSLTPNAQRREEFDAPSTFTSPYNLIFNPINTSYGKDNYAITSVPIPGVQITAAYDFFKESATEYKQVGAGYVVNGIPIPFLYNPNDVIYKFPMNYQNADSGNYSFGLAIPTLGYYGQSGKRVNVVDGWGTLTTPYGTFQTLRIKSTIYATDTVFLTSLGFGTLVKRPTKHEFKWLANGQKIPVLQIDANVTGISGNLTVTSVVYRDSIRSVPQVGISELTQNLNVELFPNPATEKAILTYELQSATDVNFAMYDVLGKEIKTEKIKHDNAGIFTKEIEISTLSKGIYFVKLEINKISVTKKLILE